MVKSCFRAFGARDVETFLELVCEDVEWSPASSLVFPDHPSVYRGHAGMRQWFEDATSLAGYSITFVRYRDVGPSSLLVTAIAVLTAPGARRQDDGLVYLLFEFEDRRVRRLRTFATEAEALEATA